MKIVIGNCSKPGNFRMKHFWLIGIFALLCACKSTDPLAVIKSRKSNVPDMIAAVENLPEAAESPNFWSRIANDQSRGDKQRRLAALQLLARHFRSGMTVSEFSKILNDPTWFSDDEVWKVRNIAGGMPVEMNVGDVVFVLPVCAHHRLDSIPSVWIRVHGEIEVEDFVLAIRRKKNKRISELPVLQVGSNEWHDDGYNIENAFGMNPAAYLR